MSIDTDEYLKKEAVTLDMSKVKIDEVKLTGLELTLTKSDTPGYYDATLEVQGHKWKYGNVKSWIGTKKKQDEILKEFTKISEAVKKGDYIIHIHGNGELTVDVQY